MKLTSAEIQSVVNLARQAGEAILSIRESQDLQIQKKGDHSPVTQADLEAHSILSKGLKKISSYPLLSEEDVVPYEDRKSWDPLWSVDPLDGTKEFLAGRDEFTVNIALIHQNRPCFGLLFAPALDQIWWAMRGEGAFTESGEPVYNHNTRSSSLVAAISRSHASKKHIELFLKNNHITQFRSFGSALKFAALALGELDVYPRFHPTSEWDTAAGQILIEEAGGQLISLESGKPLQYNRKNLVNPAFIACRKNLNLDLSQLKADH